MAQAHTEIRLAGAPLTRSRHVCAFFHAPDEAYKILLPFIKEGFERGERAVHIVNPALRQDHDRRLEHVGIDVVAAQRTRQLEVRSWDQAYLRDGHFDQDAMLALLQDLRKSGKAEGFPLTR